MFGALTRKVFGSPNDRIVRQMDKTVARINALEPEFSNLSNEALKAKTGEFRDRLSEGQTLDDLLPEAFATVREAAKRTLGQRHYDVQLMGGIVLHQGRIAEMKTGEGKTLVSTLAAYLNALPGKGVHIVTVNDYLAQRDAAWMGQIHEMLGITVGCITDTEHGKDARQAAYGADITYGTNSQFGFDYLRDNMQFRADDMVQRPFAFAIVDEVDSILIDEARTPLIISGPSVDSSEMYVKFDAAVKRLTPEHYEVEVKNRQVSLTDEGAEAIDEICREMGILPTGSIFDAEHVNMLHYVMRSLRANTVYRRDVDYIVKGGRVIIIDEHTGRMMEGRRYGEGQHQAIEAKEQVDIQRENQTLASITLQNYFRLYPKLAGMTGTAMTEAAEFEEIYKLPVVEIPTNRPVAREDQHDEIYRTEREKLDAVIDLIADCQERKQPVLVGTVSIEKSEQLAAKLKERKITHNVLNARYHEQEAFIIAQAGVPGAVTIATNMAGRGTDIQLGGNVEMRIAREIPEDMAEEARAEQIETIRAEVAAAAQVVKDAGGLFVIGTERHESRRIDNQLRGRSGRQGDPGASIFFLSLEDHLMKVFGGDRIDGMLEKLGVQEGEAIFHPWINKAIEKAQKKVEAHYFEARKNILKFDNVMNDQRKVIYDQRREIMAADDVADDIRDFRHDLIDETVAQCIPPNAYVEQWDTERLTAEAKRLFGVDIPAADWAQEEGIADEEIKARLTRMADETYARKAANYGSDVMRQVEKSVLLQTLDHIWKEHLLALDHLREGINLRAYAQRDPLNEYKSEAFGLFEAMLNRLRDQVTMTLSNMVITLTAPEAMKEAASVPEAPKEEALQFDGPDESAIAGSPLPEEGGGTAVLERPRTQARTDTAPQPASRAAGGLALAEMDPNDPSTWGKVPRNAPCPCGSGKKYKHCHGKFD